MNEWLVGLGTVLTAVGGAAGIFLLLTIRQQRRKIDATADEVVARTVEVLLGSARSEVASFKKTVGELRTELGIVRREAAVLERELHRLVYLIHTPAITLEQLRERVPVNRFEGGNEHRD